MKILLIGNEYYQQFPVLDYGGIEICVENIANGLYQLGFEFEVIVPKIIKKNTLYNFQIHEVECGPSNISGVSSKTYIELVKKHILNNNLKPDIIWSQSNWSADCLHDLGIPIICTIHDSNIDMVKSGNIKYYKNVKYRFVSNFLLEENFKGIEYSELKNKSFFLFTGLTEDQFIFEQKKDNYFLWVAGLNWGWTNKGLDIFIQLSKDYQKKDFVCYGTGNKDIEQRLKNLNISNFHYMGNLERGEKHTKVFSKANKFLMLTRIPEAFGRTTIESISKGTPVIATNIGANKELINENIGILSNNYQYILQSLEKKFNYSEIFKYSKKFSIKNEINNLLIHSKKEY
jgi:glycosyltransferase involved in cell wall biosynthesis